MFDLFDLESSLGGRVKSVLILVLITVILTYQGETQNRGEIGRASCRERV